MKILITGGTGFLGRHLGSRLKTNHEVILTGRNNKQNQFAQYMTKCDVVPMDISNIESVRDVFSYYKPELVIHAAATKFVDLSEKNPMECVDVNVTGSQNVARVSIQTGVKQVLGISTDKAAPPVRNIYGLSKAMMEKMFCLSNGKTDTQFACVRYGNVVWSTGSVFPIWEKMIQTENIIRTTGPNMFRFFFTVEDAVDLVESAMNNFSFVNGKILSQQMRASEMIKIIETWNKLTGSTWEKMESRPGERQVEYLVGDAELEYTEEITLNEKRYFLLHQNNKPENSIKEVIHSGNSSQLTEDEIVNLIRMKPIDA